ncbi:MAG: hypothetical protein AAFZ99_07410 [Pseudomonadota bacterium]
MTMLNNQTRVPENIKEAAANNTEAHHIYRNFLKTRKLIEWFDMCLDAQRRMAPQQFYFRYLMRMKGNGQRHPEDNLSPDTEFGYMGGMHRGRKVKITDMWTLNVSGAFFDRVGAVVEANDWSVATWEPIFDECQNEAVAFEQSNQFFRHFQLSQFYPKFVEAHLVSVLHRNRAAVFMELGLSQRTHAAIINNFAFPLLLKYAATSAYLTDKGLPSGRNMKHLAKNCYDSIAQRNQMPMTFDQFYDCLADF